MKSNLLMFFLATVFLTGRAWGEESVVRGRQYYLHYCASCHGENADGQGPMARVLKASPPDLRHLGERYGKPLPIGTIARFIDGRQYVSAHGPRDMPVWGKRFYDIWTAKRSSEGDLQVQIREITLYLNAIQQ
jgi:mono/diheme cytochrome c family protein